MMLYEQQQSSPKHFYSPIASPGDHRSTSNEVFRLVHVDGIPHDVKASDILDLVTRGPVESMRFLPKKNCAHIFFVDHRAALHFYVDTMMQQPQVQGTRLTFGLAKAPPLNFAVSEAVEKESACRNVYLGSLPPEITEQDLIQAMSSFGEIETIKFRENVRVAFVHFLAIRSAMRAIEQLPKRYDWAKNIKVSYGKDRSLHISKAQKQLVALYLGIPKVLDLKKATEGSSTQSLAPVLGMMAIDAMLVASVSGGPANVGNRTIYLGNIHPDAQIDDICNATRGGLLESIRYFPQKRYCFVTFADPIAAAQFYATWNTERLHIFNLVVRVSWGKHSGPLAPDLAKSIANGASRNVYVGGIPDTLTEAQVRSDFGELGEIEQINFLRDKQCVFINFTDIRKALNAIAQIRESPPYQSLKVRHGKDRCSKPPRILDYPERLRIQDAGPVMRQFTSRATAGASGGYMYPPPLMATEYQDLKAPFADMTAPDVGNSSSMGYGITGALPKVLYNPYAFSEALSQLQPYGGLQYTALLAGAVPMYGMPVHWGGVGYKGYTSDMFQYAKGGLNCYTPVYEYSDYSLDSVDNASDLENSPAASRESTVEV